jgi:hypothetical protein
MKTQALLADGVLVDSGEAIRFLRTAFDPDDWLAVLLKREGTSRVAQRVAPVSSITAAPFQDWLIRENTLGSSIYVSLNPLRARTAVRRRGVVRAVCHLFLDVDRDLDAVLASIADRRDLPPPSYVLRTSKNRGHVVWRTHGLSIGDAEALERHLAGELHTDQAATACSQLTRLPGYLNHKRSPAFRVNVAYGVERDRRYGPSDFPPSTRGAIETRRPAEQPSRVHRDVMERVRRYLAAVPPAVSGHHGDVHTFRVCCRLVRGFALSDAEALCALTGWNARCEPPWSERELIQKLQRARRYGHEPVGGLLGAQT